MSKIQAIFSREWQLKVSDKHWNGGKKKSLWRTPAECCGKSKKGKDTCVWIYVHAESEWADVQKESANVLWLLLVLLFLIAHGLMTFYERCQEPEEITSTQMEELSRHVIKLDQIEVLAEEKPTDTTSV